MLPDPLFSSQSIKFVGFRPATPNSASMDRRPAVQSLKHILSTGHHFNWFHTPVSHTRKPNHGRWSFLDSFHEDAWWYYWYTSKPFHGQLAIDGPKYLERLHSLKQKRICSGRGPKTLTGMNSPWIIQIQRSSHYSTHHKSSFHRRQT